jgi:plastocyanin
MMAAGPAAAAGPQDHRIEIKDVAFMPARMTARAGDSVVWTNADIVAHTATSADHQFDLEIAPGGTGRVTLPRPGTINYICRYHPNMKGQIVVAP